MQKILGIATLVLFQAVGCAHVQGPADSLAGVQGAWWSSCDAPAAEFVIAGTTYSGDFLGSHEMTLVGDVLTFTGGLPTGHEASTSGRAQSFRIVRISPGELILRPSGIDSHDRDWRLLACD